MERRIIPLHVDAVVGLPFAREYFDVIFSVDSYHYFGNSEAPRACSRGTAAILAG